MKRKENPIVEHGHKVFLAYSNDRAFEKRQVTRKFGKYNERSFSYTRDRLPSEELLKWMETNSGPINVLWTTVKAPEGLYIYFVVPKQAMLFKLTWGGC